MQQDARPADHLGQPGGQVGWLDPGAVRRVQGASGPGDPQPPGQLGLVQVPDDIVAVTPRAFAVEIVSLPPSGMASRALIARLSSALSS